MKQGLALFLKLVRVSRTTIAVEMGWLMVLEAVVLCVNIVY